MRDPINCNKDEAMRFLGLGEAKFAEWVMRGWIVPLHQNLYNFHQLESATQKALEYAQSARGNVAANETAEGRALRGQGRRRRRSAAQCLRKDDGGGEATRRPA